MLFLFYTHKVITLSGKYTYVLGIDKEESDGHVFNLGTDVSTDSKLIN